MEDAECVSKLVKANDEEAHSSMEPPEAAHSSMEPPEAAGTESPSAEPRGEETVAEEEAAEGGDPAQGEDAGAGEACESITSKASGEGDEEEEDASVSGVCSSLSETGREEIVVVDDGTEDAEASQLSLALSKAPLDPNAQEFTPSFVPRLSEPAATEPAAAAAVASISQFGDASASLFSSPSSHPLRSDSASLGRSFPAISQVVSVGPRGSSPVPPRGSNRWEQAWSGRGESLFRGRQGESSRGTSSGSSRQGSVEDASGADSSAPAALAEFVTAFQQSFPAATPYHVPGMYSAPYSHTTQWNSLQLQQPAHPHHQQQQQQHEHQHHYQQQLQHQPYQQQQQQSHGGAPSEYYQEPPHTMHSQQAPLYSHSFVHTNPHLHVQPQAPPPVHMEPYHSFNAYIGYEVSEDMAPPPPPPTPPTPMTTATDRVSRAIMLSLLPPPEQLPDSVLAQEIEKTWGPLRFLDLSRRLEGVAAAHFYDLRHAKSALRDIQQQYVLQQQRAHHRLLLRLRQIRDREPPHCIVQDPFLPLPNEPVPLNGLGMVGGWVVWAQSSMEQQQLHQQQQPQQQLQAQQAQQQGYEQASREGASWSANQGSLVVFNVGPSVSLDSLRALFETCGDVKEVRAAPSKKLHHFVEFFDIRAAAQALQKLAGTELAGRRIKIEFARHSGSLGGGGGGGGGSRGGAGEARGVGSEGGVGGLGAWRGRTRGEGASRGIGGSSGGSRNNSSGNSCPGSSGGSSGGGSGSRSSSHASLTSPTSGATSLTHSGATSLTHNGSSPTHGPASPTPLTHDLPSPTHESAERVPLRVPLSAGAADSNKGAAASGFDGSGDEAGGSPIAESPESPLSASASSSESPLMAPPEGETTEVPLSEAPFSEAPPSESATLPVDLALSSSRQRDGVSKSGAVSTPLGESGAVSTPLGEWDAAVESCLESSQDTKGVGPAATGGRDADIERGSLQLRDNTVAVEITPEEAPEETAEPNAGVEPKVPSEPRAGAESKASAERDAAAEAKRAAEPEVAAEPEEAAKPEAGDQADPLVAADDGEKAGRLVDDAGVQDGCLEGDEEKEIAVSTDMSLSAPTSSTAGSSTTGSNTAASSTQSSPDTWRSDVSARSVASSGSRFGNSSSTSYKNRNTTPGSGSSSKGGFGRHLKSSPMTPLPRTGYGQGNYSRMYDSPHASNQRYLDSPYPLASPASPAPFMPPWSPIRSTFHPQPPFPPTAFTHPPPPLAFSYPHSLAPAAPHTGAAYMGAAQNEYAAAHVESSQSPFSVAPFNQPFPSTHVFLPGSEANQGNMHIAPPPYDQQQQQRWGNQASHVPQYQGQGNHVPESHQSLPPPGPGQYTGAHVSGQYTGFHGPVQFAAAHSPQSMQYQGAHIAHAHYEGSPVPMPPHHWPAPAAFTPAPALPFPPSTAPFLSPHLASSPFGANQSGAPAFAPPPSSIPPSSVPPSFPSSLSPSPLFPATPTTPCSPGAGGAAAAAAGFPTYFPGAASGGYPPIRMVGAAMGMFSPAQSGQMVMNWAQGGMGGGMGEVGSMGGVGGMGGMRMERGRGDGAMTWMGGHMQSKHAQGQWHGASHGHAHGHGHGQSYGYGDLHSGSMGGDEDDMAEFAFVENAAAAVARTEAAELAATSAIRARQNGRAAGVSTRAAEGGEGSVVVNVEGACLEDLVQLGGGSTQGIATPESEGEEGVEGVGRSECDSEGGGNGQEGGTTQQDTDQAQDQLEIVAQVEPQVPIQAPHQVPRHMGVMTTRGRRDGTRTTVMVRNIPNRYNQAMLLALLDAHCLRCNSQRRPWGAGATGSTPAAAACAASSAPGSSGGGNDSDRGGSDGGSESGSVGDGGGASDVAEQQCEPLSAYDFVYLPIDFKNRCNLGYAFVNFTTVTGALRLFRAFHLQQWEAFNSRKICRVSYARVQGRAALEEHFRNSRFACDTEEFLPLVFSPPRNGIACPPPVLAAGHMAGQQVTLSGNQRFTLTTDPRSPQRDVLNPGLLPGIGFRALSSATSSAISSRNSSAIPSRSSSSISSRTGSPRATG